MDRHRKKHYLAIRGTRLKNLLEKYLLFSKVKTKRVSFHPNTKSISFQNNMLLYEKFMKLHISISISYNPEIFCVHMLYLFNRLIYASTAHTQQNIVIVLNASRLFIQFHPLPNRYICTYNVGLGNVSSIHLKP